MTLVLSLVSPRYVMHVSDRLVTAASSRAELDPLANKTVIYLARDAAVVAGYAGLASIDHKPTDEWIAETLVGADLTRPGGRGFMRVGRLVSYHRDLGQSVEALRAALEAGRKSHFATFGVEVLLAGIQWNRRGQVRRVVWWIGQEDREYHSKHYVRQQVPGQFWLGAIGSDEFTPEDLASLRGKVARTIVDTKATEDEVLEAVRRASRRSSPPVVGADCMTVTILPSQPPRIEVSYRPVLEGRAEILRDGRRSVELPAAFSPFVVGPDILAYPAVIVGGGNSLNLGVFTVSIDAPDLPPGQTIITAVSSQRRARL